MCTQLAVAKVATGAKSIGQAPTHSATPSVRITRPRYIGLRVNWQGPLVTSFRLVAEVGSISVSSRRNRTKAHTGAMNAITTKVITRRGTVRLGDVGQSSNQLIAAEIKM